MTYTLYQDDLPDGLDLGPVVAIDTETMGLQLHRDRLCLAQLSAGDGTAHLVQFQPGHYDAPNLRRLLADPNVLKLFHFARFDLAAMGHWLGAWAGPVYCTKVASKLVRTFTDRQQSSDGGAPSLTEEQLKYAAADVFHLHRLKEVLDRMLERENRAGLAAAAFAYLPARAYLDLLGYAEVDILDH